MLSNDYRFFGTLNGIYLWILPKFVKFYLDGLVLSPASEASREVENFDWRKNTHPSVYGVKEFMTLSVCLSVCLLQNSTPIISGLAK
jgi:hypothetical protein